MVEDNFYIGIVQDRFPANPVDRILVSPLMELDRQKNTWLDIDRNRCRQLFPDKGLVIHFSDDPNILKNQVLKFKLYRNSKYIQGEYQGYSKFSIDKNNFCLLFELLILEFQDSLSNLRDRILSNTLIYNH